MAASEDLEEFRQQWQNELAQQQAKKTTRSPAKQLSTVGSVTSALPVDSEYSSVEDKAADLFLQGVALEKEGRLYEAIRFYRQAVRLVPDIERQLPVTAEPPPSPPRSGERRSELVGMSVSVDSLGLQFTQLGHTHCCYPDKPQQSTHVSALPMEVLLVIFRWVVSELLDLRSLECLALVCRGFYCCARFPDIWKAACVKIWKGSVGRPVLSWRQMFIDRAHPLFHGVYISRTEYIRSGEKSLDGCYRPFHVVVYFRYVRFYPNGTLLFATSPDEPVAVISKLHCDQLQSGAVLRGHYRLHGDKVVAIATRLDVEGNPGNRRRRHAAVASSEHTFTMEWQLLGSRRRAWGQLSWLHYSCNTLNKATGHSVHCDLPINNQFPPFYFSRVKSYTANSSPL